MKRTPVRRRNWTSTRVRELRFFPLSLSLTLLIRSIVEDEKHLVEEVFNNAIDLLSDDDKKLPQINTVLPLLKKGVGIHHSGLLPIIKETIEILFGEGLIKALFATETFSMGLNMPARTVLFTTARKFDGKELRWVNERTKWRGETNVVRLFRSPRANIFR